MPKMLARNTKNRVEGAHETRIDGPKVERRERTKGKESLVELSGLGR